jgi:transketolase
VESLVAWKTAIEAKRPASLILSRQGVPYISRQQKQIDAIARGAYVLFESESELQVIIIATGTEVGIALEAAQQLAEKNIGVRLVSMPSAETFGMQSDDYREQVLPRAVRARLAVEAGTSDYWRKFVGIDGEVIGVDEFGASAPGPELMKYFGFTVENIVQRAENLI